MKQLVLTVMALWAAALVVNLTLGTASGLGKPLISDSRYYLGVARNLAEGKGYVDSGTYWPTSPSMQRLPGWPFVGSLALRLFPGTPPDAVMRVTDLVLNAAVAPLVFLLTLSLFRRTGAAIAAGLAYILHPVGLHLACQGLSEPLFLVLAAVGFLLLLRGGMAPCVGMLFLGIGCLIRANFVLWIVFFAALIFRYALRGEFGRKALLCLILGGCLFLLSPLLWAARNYMVCRQVPVLSTLRGQTFYGGNNAVVANDPVYWGYWVFPNAIPGETRAVDLAQRMSEYEVDAYYFGRGLQYVKEHVPSMPLLCLGKLLRSFSPVPWNPSPSAWALGLLRLAIYAGTVAGLVVGWRSLPAVFRAAFLALAATDVATVLIFWGNARFAFPLEVFFLPFFALGAVGMKENMIRWNRMC